MPNVKKSLEETAYRHNVTVSEVENEIQLMIDELYDSDDLKIREAWRQICPNGEKPTVEQLIEYAVTQISIKKAIEYRKPKSENPIFEFPLQL